MIHTLSSKLNQRKSKLNIFLNNNSDELSLEKRHQIIGSLNEMDYILNVLNQHKNLEVHQENNPDDVFLFKPIRNMGFVHNIKNYIKKMK